MNPARICDFANSYATFTTKDGGNTARIQLGDPKNRGVT